MLGRHERLSGTMQNSFGILELCPAFVGILKYS
jgi:hypothetical protein